MQDGPLLHGFFREEFLRLHFGQVEAPPGVATLLVAPKGPGHLVRSEFERGGGVPCLIAFNADAKEETTSQGQDNKMRDPRKHGRCRGDRPLNDLQAR